MTPPANPNPPGSAPVEAPPTPPRLLDPAIRVAGLCKRFGRLQVLDSLDLEIEAGKTTAILGPNGAGKTTLIKSILGLVIPDAGTIEVAGTVLDGSPQYRERIGYMPQIARYPENLTAREIMAMVADLRDNPEGLDTSLVQELRMEEELDKPFRTLSGGNRQKVSAVLSLLFRPEILFLDEPTAGLDPVSSSVLKDRLLKDRASGRTLILTSHVMAEVQELADSVVYLLEGRIHFRESVESLMGATGESSLERAIARRITARVVA
ncbi:MAG: ABC transporter ATP-binding protein [Gemmatimonadota bacterium]